MRNSEYVTMLGVQETRRMLLREGRYLFNAKHRWAWVRRLQVALFQLLIRSGSVTTARDEVVEEVRVPLDGYAVMELVWRVRGDMLRRLNRRPRKILIGAVDYEELIGRNGALIGMGSPIELRGELGHDGTIFSIPIEVVPQMQGVVVLP